MANGIAVKVNFNGKILKRKTHCVQMGNFVMNIVRVANSKYLIGDGDEYIRGGYEKIFELGRKLT